MASDRSTNNSVRDEKNIAVLLFQTRIERSVATQLERQACCFVTGREP